MKVMVYCNGLESKITDKITSHIHSNWSEATIYTNSDATASPITETSNRTGNKKTRLT